MLGEYFKRYRRPHFSFVVIAHNMMRELPRTLHSLSPEYQLEASQIPYEIIVVENGSTHGLPRSCLRGHGRRIRYFAMPEGHVSPARAVNFGVARARADIVCVMIDGAHLLTPGILMHARRAFGVFRHPVVTPHYFYLGHGQQPHLMEQGYDQQAEDALLASIDWPSDGYRLFEIGQMIGMKRRGWATGKFESNCLFIHRDRFLALGGYDERFDLAGGGFVNLDFFRRAVDADGSELVILLGEGTFHQFHGGTTTNASGAEREEKLALYRRQYEELTGTGFARPARRPFLFGQIPTNAAVAAARLGSNGGN